MNKWQEIGQELKAALKQGDREKVSVLRMLASALNSQKHASGRQAELDINDDEALAVIKSEIKKRKDAIDAYKQAERQDLAEKEERELAILKEYLPEQVPESELRQLAREAISQADAAGKSDFGRVMGEMMKKVKGRAEGDAVKRIVEEELEK